MSAEQIFEAHILNKFPAGIFNPLEGSPNFLICSYLRDSINTYFDKNSVELRIDTPHFYIIQSDTINGCAFTEQGQHFIGITKGVIDYSAFIFRNIMRDNALLPQALWHNIDQQPIIVAEEDFTSWASFCVKNDLSFEALDYNPNSNERRIISEALSQYFIFFVVTHEVGHLRQRNPHYLFELEDAGGSNISNNLEQQVYEMDADKFAVNMLAEHLITTYNERHLEKNAPYRVFFRDEQLIVEYSIFMLYFMFYFFAHNKRFDKYVTENAHPHPALRVRWSTELLINCLELNVFLPKEELRAAYKRSFQNFGNTMEKIFPNSNLRLFFNLVRDKELALHHDVLQELAKGYKNLNGQY